jgi:uncharacterized protein (DUF1330 family)
MATLAALANGVEDRERGMAMAAYFVVQATVTDEPRFQKYREAVVPFIAKFGGKVVAKGAKVTVLEGAHDTRPVVMFEFPTMEAIHAFWDSPDYVPIKKMREGIATIDLWAFPGA